MGIRSSLTKGLLLALAVVLIPVSAISAQKITPGSPCKVLNQKAIYLNKTYTCVKSGKKLLWNKGVAIVKPAPTATPTPELTPTPTPTPTVSATPTPTPVPVIEDDSVNISRGIIYRYSNGVLERQAAKSGKYFAQDSRSNSNFDQIRVKAYEEIRGKITNASHPNFTFTWDIKPSFPSEIASFLKDTAEKAASFWGWVFKEQLTVPAQLVTEQDLEWQKTQDLRFSDTVDILNLFTTDGYKQQSPWVGGGGHFWYRSANDPKVYSLLSFQTPSYAAASKMKGDWVMVAAHEVTHIIQDYYRKGRTETNIPAYDLRANGTFQEGSATLFGFALGLNNVGWYSDSMDEFLYTNFRNDNYWKPITNTDDVIKLLEATESRTNNSTHQSSYSVGALLYEWVIAKYGFDSYIKILENLPNNADYSDTIKNSLGISKAELYRGAAPYILDAFKRVKL